MNTDAFIWCGHLWCTGQWPKSTGRGVSKLLSAGAKEDCWPAAFSRTIGSLERRRAIEILFLGRQRRWARTRVNETLPDLV
jgi:hypothetical protein